MIQFYIPWEGGTAHVCVHTCLMQKNNWYIEHSHITILTDNFLFLNLTQLKIKQQFTSLKTDNMTK